MQSATPIASPPNGDIKTVYGKILLVGVTIYTALLHCEKEWKK